MAHGPWSMSWFLRPWKQTTFFFVQGTWSKIDQENKPCFQKNVMNIHQFFVIRFMVYFCGSNMTKKACSSWFKESGPLDHKKINHVLLDPKRMWSLPQKQSTFFLVHIEHSLIKQLNYGPCHSSLSIVGPVVLPDDPLINNPILKLKHTLLFFVWWYYHCSSKARTLKASMCKH